MTQGREPQQPAEAFFQLHVGELRADPFPGARAGGDANACLLPDLRQDLSQIRRLHVH
jgi:hypothetical protein